MKSGAIDYIKLRKGVMITISRDRIAVFNSDDLEVKGAGVRFKDVVTSKDGAFDGKEG